MMKVSEENLPKCFISALIFVLITLIAWKWVKRHFPYGSLKFLLFNNLQSAYIKTFCSSSSLLHQPWLFSSSSYVSLYQITHTNYLIITLTSILSFFFVLVVVGTYTRNFLAKLHLQNANVWSFYVLHSFREPSKRERKREWKKIPKIWRNICFYAFKLHQLTIITLQITLQVI